jgi:hypothetical protein
MKKRIGLIIIIFSIISLILCTHLNKITKKQCDSIISSQLSKDLKKNKFLNAGEECCFYNKIFYRKGKIQIKNNIPTCVSKSNILKVIIGICGIIIGFIIMLIGYGF